MESGFRFRGSRWVPVALALAIVAVAAVLRMTDLISIPEGIQGDEAAEGIQARDILANGSIGPYSTIASGSPAGFMYLLAIAFRLFGDTFETIRLTSAIIGVVTVPIFIAVYRKIFDPWIGLMGGVLLAACGWHIDFSRIAFPNILWIPMILLGIGAIERAFRGDSHTWHAVAGATLSLGLYTYNGQQPFLAIVLPLLAIRYLVEIRKTRQGTAIHQTRLLDPLLLAASFIITTIPMAQYARQYPERYFGKSDLSIFVHPPMTDMVSIGQKVDYVVRRYIEFWNRMFFKAEWMPIDITGLTPMLSWGLLIFAIAGIVISLWKYRTWYTLIALAVTFVLPLASVASLDFAMRRSQGILPFVLVFAAIGCIDPIRMAAKRSSLLTVATAAAVIALSTFTVHQSLHDYFEVTVPHQYAKQALAVGEVDAVRYVEALPDGYYVYWLSANFPWSHETRRYLVPDQLGEDRGGDWGEHSLEFEPAKGKPVFILLPSYFQDLPELQARYPGGSIVYGHHPSFPDGTWIAFYPEGQ